MYIEYFTKANKKNSNRQLFITRKKLATELINVKTVSLSRIPLLLNLSTDLQNIFVFII